MSSGHEEKSITEAQKLYYLIERNRFDLAKSMLAQAMAKQPDDLELQYISAIISYETGRTDESKDSLKYIISRDPDHHNAKYLLCRVHIEKTEFAESELLLIELIREFPYKSQFFATYAKLMLQTMNIEKAEQLAAQALRLEPENPEALTASILCSVVNGHSTSVNERISDLFRKYPDTATSANSLYFVLAERKQYWAARRIARELLKSSPEDEDYLKMVKDLRAITHPLMLPLYPLIRWGWTAATVIWLFGIIIFKLVSNYMPNILGVTIIIAYFAYIVYSWIVPPLLRRLLK